MFVIKKIYYIVVTKSDTYNINKRRWKRDEVGEGETRSRMKRGREKSRENGREVEWSEVEREGCGGLALKWKPI